MMVSTWAFVAWVFFALVMAWRVWRLEDSRREVYDTMRQMLKLNDIGRASEVDVLRAENRMHEVLGRERRKLHDLARALGYEWKRTEAKEGWERKNPFISDCVRKLDADINDIVSGRTIYVDRRKGERRKPTASSLAADDMLKESNVAKAVKRGGRRRGVR